jgi:prefoldin subunit 5
MSPMESQVREHQLQLRRRLESVKRIHKAADTLEDRIVELEQLLAEVNRQFGDIHALSQRIETTLAGQPDETARLAA